MKVPEYREVTELPLWLYLGIIAVVFLALILVSNLFVLGGM